MMAVWIWIVVIVVVVSVIVLSVVLILHKGLLASLAGRKQLADRDIITLTTYDRSSMVSSVESVAYIDDVVFDSNESYTSYHDEWSSPYAPRHGVGSYHHTAHHHPFISNSLIPPPSSTRNRYTIVLDLDETLVHSADKVMDMSVELITVPVDAYSVLYTHVRPYCRELLRELKGICEVVLWTAGTREYAAGIVTTIDDSGSFEHKIFRDRSWFSYPNYSKPLSYLARDLNYTLLVDNSESVVEDRQNAIVIEDFVGDHRDHLLLTLRKILKGLIKSGRPVPEFLGACRELVFANQYYRLARSLKSRL